MQQPVFNGRQRHIFNVLSLLHPDWSIEELTAATFEAEEGERDRAIERRKRRREFSEMMAAHELRQLGQQGPGAGTGAGPSATGLAAVVVAPGGALGVTLGPGPGSAGQWSQTNPQLWAQAYGTVFPYVPPQGRSEPPRRRRGLSARARLWGLTGSYPRRRRHPESDGEDRPAEGNFDDDEDPLAENDEEQGNVD